jgi:hypothetical protein
MHNAIDLTDDNAGPNNIDSNTPSGNAGTSYTTCTTFVSLMNLLGPLFGATPFNPNCASDDAGTGGWIDRWPLGKTSGTVSGPAPKSGSSTTFQPGKPVQCPPDKSDISAGATPNTCMFVVFPVAFSLKCYNIPLVTEACIPDSDLPNDGISILNKDVLSAKYTYVVPPTVTNVNPNTGSSAGHGLVTITGTGFALGSGTTFAFGPGDFATNVNCASQTTCTASTPPHPIGRVNVVATAYGLSSSVDAGDMYSYVSPYPASGYWLATAGGSVFAAGQAPSLGGTADPATDPVVAITSTSHGRGYWLVTATGNVMAFGDAAVHGTLPGRGVSVDDIVAIAPTGDDRGYWLIGRDGGEFAFGDARFHGSLPGVRVHVRNVVGMAATADGGGYWIASSDGGVFAFGDAHFAGSLPRLGVHVHNVIAIVPSRSRAGYMLAGADGGTFAFGGGIPFFGSLPDDGIHVSDVIGLARTPDSGGYWVAGSAGVTYGFGDAQSFAQPSGLTDHLPVVGIAST